MAEASTHGGGKRRHYYTRHDGHACIVFPLPKTFVLCGTAWEAERVCRGAMHCALVDSRLLSQGAMHCAPTHSFPSLVLPTLGFSS